MASVEPGSGEEMEEAEAIPPAQPSSSSNFLSCLDVIISLGDCESQLLLTLMQAHNLEGYTPFMSAVTLKAVQLSSEDTQCLSSMLFPTGSHPDDNPLFVLCQSDPCSLTWIGQEHIYYTRTYLSVVPVD